MSSSCPATASLRTLTDTTALRKTLAPVLTPPVEFFTVDVGGGVTLDGWMLKPPRLRPGAAVSACIVFVYGEPAGADRDRPAGAAARMLFHRALADAGYVVVSVDNRGTPAPKGAAWRKVVYGTVGDLSSKEQAAAVARARRAASRSSIATRVGIWGWSGGGSNTLNAMFRFPDVYQGRRGGRAGAGPDALRHDLPGALHGPAAGQRRRLPLGLADQLRRGPARATCSSCTARATTTCTTRAPSGWSTGSSSSASRST